MPAVRTLDNRRKWLGQARLRRSNAWPGLDPSQPHTGVRVQNAVSRQFIPVSVFLYYPKIKGSLTVVGQLYSSNAVITHRPHVKHETHVKPRLH